MHIEFVRDDGTGRAMLRAQGRAEDRALPVDSLILDADPTILDSDRIALAGALLFGTFASGDISVGTSVSADAANAIRAVTDHRVTSEVSGRVLERKGSDQAVEEPLPATTLHVALTTDLRDRTPEVDHTRLGLVPGERYQGALFGIKEAVISSNAWLLARFMDPAAVLLAAGLLFSHDLLVRTLVIEHPDGSPVPVSPSARELCAAAGIDVP